MCCLVYDAFPENQIEKGPETSYFSRPWRATELPVFSVVPGGPGSGRGAPARPRNPVPSEAAAAAAQTEPGAPELPLHARGTRRTGAGGAYLRGCRRRWASVARQGRLGWRGRRGTRIWVPASGRGAMQRTGWEKPGKEAVRTGRPGPAGPHPSLSGRVAGWLRARAPQGPERCAGASRVLPGRPGTRGALRRPRAARSRAESPGTLKHLRHTPPRTNESSPGAGTAHLHVLEALQRVLSRSVF